MNVGNVYCVLTAFYDLFNDGNSFLRNYGKGDYRKCVCIKTEDWNSNIGWLIPADKGMIDEASTVYDIQVYINDISYILHLDYIFVCDKHFTIKDPNEQTSAIPQLNEKDIERVKRKYERLSDKIQSLSNIDNDKLMYYVIGNASIRKWGLESFKKGYKQGYDMKSLWRGYTIQSEGTIFDDCVKMIDGYGEFATNEQAARRASNEGINILWDAVEWMESKSLVPDYPVNTFSNYYKFSKLSLDDNNSSDDNLSLQES